MNPLPMIPEDDGLTDLVYNIYDILECEDSKRVPRETLDSLLDILNTENSLQSSNKSNSRLKKSP